MVETLQKAGEMGELEQTLAERLSRTQIAPPSLQISCGLRQNRLMVLVHSCEASAAQPSQLFEGIRAAIAEEYPQYLETLHLYLIIHGQPILSEATGIALRPWTAARRSPLTLYRQTLRSPYFRLSRLHLYRLQSRLQRRLPPNLRQFFSLQKLGIGAGFLVATFGLYALARPCTIGACPRLAEVEQQASNAMQSLLNAAEIEDYRDIRNQIQQASRQLEQIPPWSAHRTAALRQVSAYQQQVRHLDRLIAALALAENAQRSQLAFDESAGVSLREARQAEKLWQEAIANLQSLPSQSPLDTLALHKQRDYQSRLTQLQQHLQLETKAIAHLDAAEEAATLAQSREQTARSLADWQKVTATWKAALQRLRQVPPNSASYTASRQAIEGYLPQLVRADKRREIEAAATRRAQKASQLAADAQKSQTQQQWNRAARQWQQAIAQLQAIPSQSQEIDAARAQMTSYRLALQQAEIQRRAANQRQALQGELEDICRDRAHICDFWLGDRSIRLILTPAYLAQIWNTALQAQAQANLPTQIELLDHVSRLEQALQSLSQRAGIPIEVYDARGTLLSRYGTK